MILKFPAKYCHLVRGIVFTCCIFWPQWHPLGAERWLLYVFRSNFGQIGLTIEWPCLNFCLTTCEPSNKMLCSMCICNLWCQISCFKNLNKHIWRPPIILMLKCNLTVSLWRISPFLYKPNSLINIFLLYIPESFSAKGIGRHMNSCTGPKQRRQSRGRGGRKRGMGRKSFGCMDDAVSENTQAGTSASSNIPGSSSGLGGDIGSNFGLMTTDLVKCPMCSKDFPLTLIEVHAAMCGESQVMMFDTFNTQSGNSSMVSGSINPIWIGWSMETISSM